MMNLTIICRFFVFYLFASKEIVASIAIICICKIFCTNFNGKMIYLSPEILFVIRINLRSQK